ncbi:MAG TPA: hypothetical protein VIX89_01325 [Bryobacteraceae bacterium]
MLQTWSFRRQFALTLICGLAGWTALCADSPTVLDKIPTQYAGTAYTGPEYIPHENGTDFVTPSGQDTGGLSVSASGQISGTLDGTLSGKTLKFDLCAAPAGSSDCTKAVANYQIAIKVQSRLKITGGSNLMEIHPVQYIGSSYNGPLYVGGQITGDLKFKAVAASDDTAGISIDENGQLSGDIRPVAPGLKPIKACVIARADTSADPKCVREAVLVVTVQSRPRIEIAMVASNGNGGGGNGAAANVEIRDEVVPGQTQFYGNGTPTKAGGTVEVRIFPRVNDKPVTILDAQGASQPFVKTDANGQWFLTLSRGVVAGDQLKVVEIPFDTSTGSPGTSHSSAQEPVVDPLDLGRVRYYFTSGVVLSNSRDFALQSSSTQAGIFLGLDADRAWIVPSQPGFGNIGINTYFDARLTSVATQAMNPGSAAADNLTTFISSKKAASLLAGTYFPIATGYWDRGTAKYSFFVAPLAKAGFTTLADDTAPVTTPAAGTTTNVTNRFFTSYAYGLRLGVFHNFMKDKTNFDTNTGPELVSYVDVTTGKFGNFEAIRDLTPGAPSGPTDPPHPLHRVRPWRYSFEGLLKIPHSVFVIGFSANIGRGAYPPEPDEKNKTLLRPFTSPRDDLRFLFGARFDFSRFLQAIPKL